MEQRSKEWFEARKGRLTGSNIGAALGVNPWKKPDDLIREMVRTYHNVEREFTGNPATEYGQFHEAGAQSEYEIETGNTVEPCGFFKHEDWAGASPDGIINGSGILEIKCPFGQRNKTPPEFKSINDQPHYYAQIQWEMFCAKTDWAHFYQWCVGGSKLEHVVFDAQWMQDNWCSIKAFYNKYLSEIDNPNHLEPKRQQINNAQTRKLILEIDELNDQIDFAKDRKNEIIETLVSLSKGRDSVICGRKLTKVVRKGNVDYSKIPELKGVELEQYRKKSSEHWRFSL